MNAAYESAEKHARILIAEVDQFEIPQEDIEDDARAAKQVYGGEFTLEEFRTGQIPVRERWKSDAFAIAAGMMIEQIQKRGHADIIKKVADFATQAMVEICEGKDPK